MSSLAFMKVDLASESMESIQSWNSLMVLSWDSGWCGSLRVSYGCHEISKSTSLDCNKIHSDSVVREDCMWESLGDSHAIAIQWVHMGVDPLLCVCTNIVIII